MPSSAERVQPPGPLDLEPHQLSPRLVGTAAPRVGAEAPDVLGGQVHAPPVEVLADVAEEVGQLEGEAEVTRRAGRGVRPWLEDRQHHLADDGRRSVHVAEEVVPRLVLGHRKVHRHRAQEPAEAAGIDGERAHGVHDRLEEHVVRAAAPEGVVEPALEGGEVGAHANRRDRPRRRCRRPPGRRRRGPTRGAASRAAAPSSPSSTSCRAAWRGRGSGRTTPPG